MLKINETMRNGILTVGFDCKGGLSVRDGRTGKTWLGTEYLAATCFDVKNSAPKVFYPGHAHGFAVTSLKTGTAKQRTRFLYEHKDAGFKFLVEYTLCRNSLEVRIPFSRITEDVKRFPLMSITPLPGWGGVRTGEEGYLLLPEQSGMICRFDKKKSGQLRNLIYGRTGSQPNSTTMPVFGMAHGDSAFSGIITGGQFDTELIADVHTKSDKRNAAYIMFHYRHEKTDPVDPVDRSIRYSFLAGEDAGYAGMAKTYRQYLLKEKKIFPLKQRAKKNSTLDYYLKAYNDIRIDMGIKRSKGPGVKGDGKGRFIAGTTFEEAKEIIDAVKESGIDRATFILVGWTLDGADGAYPTKFPPDERLGGKKGLESLIRRAQSYGYQIVSWDNYTDAYELSPGWNKAFIQKNRDGSMVTPNWYWAGGLAYKICPEHGIFMFKKNIPRMKKLGFNGVWLCDAMPIGLYACFDKNHMHTHTKRSTAEGYRKIAALAQKSFGGCHVENAHDYMAGVCDAVSCTPVRKGGAGKKKDALFYEYFFGTPVPFYQIAYHGLVIYHLYSIENTKKDDCELLREIEYGAMPRSEVPFTNPGGRSGWTAKWLPAMKEQYDVLCRELGRLQLQFIENHREIAPSVFETTYSDGTIILVNYTDRDYAHKGIVCKAHWYAQRRTK